MRISKFAGLAAFALIAPLAFAAAQIPTRAEQLTRVKAKRLDLVYVTPGSDFRHFTRVKLDPVEVAFKKNWLRDYNRATRGVSRIDESDVNRVIREASARSHEIFTRAYTKAGYQVTEESGPGVVRIRTGIVDLAVSAPEVTSGGRSRTFSNEAGVATFVIEARDSVSGALLARALDRQIMGDDGALMRTSVSNRADFEQLIRVWANASARGLDELKARSPLQP